MKHTSIVAIAGLGVMLSGCASIIEGTTQPVAVTTPQADGAKCSLVNSEGTWYLTTPGSAQVHKTKNDLNVSCKKDGFQDGNLVVQSHFNGVTLGNVIAGGVIGIGVDAATGANFNYPLNVSIPMTPLGASMAPVGTPVAANAAAAPDPTPYAPGQPHVDTSGTNMQPAYPPAALVNKEEGSVVVQALVNPDGKVSRMRLATSSGYNDLDNAAIAAVMGWRFVPASNGSSAWANVKIDFSLPPPPPSAPPAH